MRRRIFTVKIRCPYCKRFYIVRTTDGGLRRHGCPPVHEGHVEQTGANVLVRSIRGKWEPLNE